VPALKTLLLFVSLGAALQAATPGWLDRVAPVITSAEKKAYLSLQGEDRAKFEENFFSNKSVTAEEYFRRLDYIDSTFGSGKVGSGANTDQGRVYLSLGPPTSVKRLPSSRIFVPIEIWYYDIVPGLLNTELRLIFYRKNSIGFPKLYSPTIDTIRALLLPEAATVEAFGPNDSLTESDLRQILNVPPAEDEVISAAVNVATGIKYSGNDEILGQITSPQTMLRRPLKTAINSRLIVSRAKLDVFRSDSEYGGSQVDLRLETSATRELDMEIVDGMLPVYQSQLHLNFSKAQSIVYVHRVDLLPGTYRVIFAIDGKPSTYPLEVTELSTMGEILRADQSDASDLRLTPFQFNGKQLELNPDGNLEVVTLSRPEKVTWKIRRGTEVVWRSATEPARIAAVALPTGFPPGTYMIDADTANDSRSTEIVFRGEAHRESDNNPQSTMLSYNANLAPALRLAFLGHQWLLRGKLDEARRSLRASLDKGATDDAQIELARVDALTGSLDAARERVRNVLARNPNSFEALSVFAYVETSLQDYSVAAELYRRALAIQESPTLRSALAELSRRERGN
jgi:GWxTD domain-containing protein